MSAPARPKTWAVRERPDFGSNLTGLLARADEAFLTGNQGEQSRCLRLLEMKLKWAQDKDFEGAHESAQREPDPEERNWMVYQAYHDLMNRRHMLGTKTTGDRM